MKLGTTMDYLGEYTGRVFDTETKEEHLYRPFPTIQAAHQHICERHGKVAWVRWSDYKRHYASKTHRHKVK